MKNAKSIACIVHRGVIDGNKFRVDNVLTFKERLGIDFNTDLSGIELHENENFADEGFLGKATSFFVGGPKKNLMLTAGHFLDKLSKAELENTCFVFDYHSLDKGVVLEKNTLKIPLDKVYQLEKIVAMKNEVDGKKRDWALIKVKRMQGGKVKEVITDRDPFILDFKKPKKDDAVDKNLERGVINDIPGWNTGQKYPKCRW